jgi:hypothetical protein
MALTRDSLQKYLGLLNQNKDEMGQEELNAPIAPNAPALPVARDPFSLPQEVSQPAPMPMIAQAEEPAQTITDTPNPQASGLQAMLQQLKEAQSKREDLLRLGAMQNAFSKVGAGIAGSGAKATPMDSSFIKALAEQPVNQLTENFSFTKLQREAQDEDALRDPESSISKLYKQQASKQGLEVEPNMSAQDVKELIKLQKNKTTQGFQQSQFIEKDSGDPLIFDPNTSDYMNAVTKEPVDPGNVIRNYMKTITDPLTGQIIEVRPGQGNVGVIAGGAKVQTSDEKESKVSAYQKMNPKERDYLNKDVTQKFQDETKPLRESLAKVDRVAEKATEAVSNPIAAAQLGAEVATIFENGRLTDEDVLRYTRRKGIEDRFTDALEEAISGKITKEKAKLIQDTLRKYSSSSRELLSKEAHQKAKLFQERSTQPFNIHDVSKLIYGDYKPPGSSSTNKTKVKNVITGKTFMAPNENLDKVLSVKQRGVNVFKLVD